jgi:AraC-like DNA-binding protein
MTENLTKRDYFEDPAFPLQVHIRDPQPEFPLHSHGFDELVIILRGTGIHVVDGQSFPVKSGDAFIVSSEHEHQYQDMHGLALANILFDSKALGMPQWDIRSMPGFHALFELEPVLRTQQKFNSRLQLSERQLNTINDRLRELQYETSAKAPGYRVMAKGLFMQLAVYLSRCYSENPKTESIDLLRLGDVIALIETGFAEKISLDSLAKTANLSKRHFQRIFQECIGRSPIDHLLHILKHSSKPIIEIAFDCGFGDSNYFTRQFRKIMNQTPSHYRQTNQ